jgi:hypothetical protein
MTLEAVEAQRRCTVSTRGAWKTYRLEFEAELTRNVTIRRLWWAVVTSGRNTVV